MIRSVVDIFMIEEIRPYLISELARNGEIGLCCCDAYCFRFSTVDIDCFELPSSFRHVVGSHARHRAMRGRGQLAVLRRELWKSKVKEQLYRRHLKWVNDKRREAHGQLTQMCLRVHLRFTSMNKE